jgi:hypothetical protein
LRVVALRGGLRLQAVGGARSAAGRRDEERGPLKTRDWASDSHGCGPAFVPRRRPVPSTLRLPCPRGGSGAMTGGSAGGCSRRRRGSECCCGTLLTTAGNRQAGMEPGARFGGPPGCTWSCLHECNEMQPNATETSDMSPAQFHTWRGTRPCRTVLALRTSSARAVARATKRRF